jgi:nicotinamidase-related amidase
MDRLLEHSSAYLEFLEDWLTSLSSLDVATLDPARTALVSVDVSEGFCREGALASPRVAAIIPSVKALVLRLEAHGLKRDHIAFVQDAHPEDAQEFAHYPPHCVKGTHEAEAVHELQALPHWQQHAHFEKNSIASHTSAGFEHWLRELDVDTIIAVGDVTDLCLYTLALHLQVRNIAQHLKQRVIVPENCAQTWDAPDHPGDLYHALFLHQLARNGVEVVREVV